MAPGDSDQVRAQKLFGYQQLRAGYRFQARGETKLKGRGRMRTCLLEGRLATGEP